MEYSRGIAALVVLAGAAVAAAGEPALAPQPGLLLLRNGHILRGQITQAGDYYLVLLGKTSEIRLPAKEVEAQVASLDEAYNLKRHGMFGRGAAPHLELADWCLRQGLHARCGAQLAAARQVEAENPRIAEIQRRLELASAPPTDTKPQRPAPAAASASVEKIESAVRALPRGTVEKFTAVVQPLLLNRCGANQCHGPNAKTELHLLRPPAGQTATQRFTHRNLYSVLQQLDASDPAASPLLIEAQRRHGNTLTAAFDKQTQRQFEELKAWVLTTLAVPETIAPATIPADGQAALSQAAPQPGQATPADPSAGQPPLDGAAPKSASAGDRFVPRDPFDPELFNRRFRARQP